MTRKRFLKRPEHRRKNNIKIILKGIGWKDMDWTHLVENMGTSGESCEHHNEPLGSKEAGNFSNS
jgi:hypothetical protein